MQGHDIAASAAVACILYTLLLTLYRLTLHPLSKYPGPKPAALTNWYATFYAWRGDLHIQTRKWHQRYGKTIRTGPNTLNFDSHAAMGEIYGVRANVCKADGYAILSASRRSPNTVTAIDKGVHGFKRRILAQVFSDQGLRQVEERILKTMRGFVGVLGPGMESRVGEEGWGEEKDMGHICDWLAFDIISDLCFGESFDMLGRAELRWLPAVVVKIAQRSMMSVVQPKVFQYKFDRVFLASKYRHIRQAGSWIKTRSDARIKLGNDIKEKDMFYTMMNATDPKTGMGFTPKDLWVESMLLLAAGSDTTSSAMSAAFFYLTHHAQALSRATTEIRTTFANEEEIRSGAQLNSCKYLAACINETMRLVPSVSSAPPRRVQDGGITIDGEFFAPGTTVGTSIYTIQRNSAYFDRPDEFIPERWIVEEGDVEGEERVRRANLGFCPFSIGSRSCVGWKLAWMELNVAIARALFLYDVRLAPGARCCLEKGDGECEYRFMGWVTTAVEGPVVQFRWRQSGP